MADTSQLYAVSASILALASPLAIVDTIDCLGHTHTQTHTSVAWGRGGGSILWLYVTGGRAFLCP